MGEATLAESLGWGLVVMGPVLVLVVGVVRIEWMLRDDRRRRGIWSASEDVAMVRALWLAAAVMGLGLVLMAGRWGR